MRSKSLKRLILRGERHNPLPFLLLIIFFLFTSRLLGNDVYFGAKHLKYLADEKLVILQDSAWIRDKENSLLADSILYFQDLDLIKGYGNAVLITGKDSFIGDSLYYNTKLKTGHAFSGYTIKEKGKIWGSMAYKDSLDNIYIKHGFYTTCLKDTPDYFFQAQYIKVVKREMAIAKPVILRVHNVPIMAVPFWMFPVKEGRKSGFLTPSVGFNSISGKYLRNLAYYLVINNYMDLTTSMDIVENVGIRGNIDFLYKLYKHFSGEVKYSRAENLWQRSSEWSLAGWHKHNLPYHTTLQAKIDYVSNYNYYNEYSETKVEWLKRELHSYLTIQRSSLPIPFTFTIDDRIQPDKKNRQSLIPSIQYSLPTISFLNMRVTGGILRKRSEDSTKILTNTGARNSISLGLNYTLLHYLRFNTGVNSNLNILPKDTANSAFTLQKSLRLSQGFSTTLYGFSIFGLPFMGIQKFMHILSTSVSFSLVPSVKNDTVIFQYGSFYTPGKYLTLSLQNTFWAKASSKKLHLLSLNLSANYNFKEKKWDNVPINFTLSEKLPLKIRGNIQYNTENKTFENPSIFITSSFKLPLFRTSFVNSLPGDTDSTKISKERNFLSANFNYTITKNQVFTSQTIALNGRYRISPSIKGGFSISYDLSHGKYLARSLSLKKDLHCWELDFSYNKYGNIWDYNFRVFIKKIPDIKLDKGLLRSLLP